MAAGSVGRFVLLDVAARRPFGVLWRARDEVSGRVVALKMLSLGRAPGEAAASRFRTDARFLARVAHSSLLPIDELEIDGDVFVVRRWLEGGSLETRLDDGALSPSDALPILRRVGGALDAAHAVGLVHRDVKASNVLFDAADRACLADFGLAALRESCALAGSGAPVPAPLTIAPEAAQGREPSPAADRYSFAALAYLVLSGEPPFTGPNALSLIHQHASVLPPPISVRASLPDELDEVFGRALAKDPAARPRTCGALVSAIAAAFPEVSETAETPFAREERVEEAPRIVLAMPEPRNPFMREGAPPPAPPPLPEEDDEPAARIELGEFPHASSAFAPVSVRRRASAALVLPVVVGGALAVVAMFAASRAATRGAIRASSPRPAATRPAAVVPAAAPTPESVSVRDETTFAAPAPTHVPLPTAVAAAPTVPAAPPAAAPTAVASAHSPARPAGAPLSGRWRIENVVQSTSFAKYRGLKIGYLVRLRSDGTRLVGEGEKCCENGRELPRSARTPIRLTGTVRGTDVEATFVEHGKKRQTTGRFSWRVSNQKELVGRFGSGAAGSSGVSTAARIAG